MQCRRLYSTASLDLKRLVIVNIPKEQSIDNLKQRLAAFGDIIKMQFPLELTIQPNKGFAYVHFKDFSSKQKALHAIKGVPFENGLLFAIDDKREPTIPKLNELKHTIFVRGIGTQTTSASLKSLFEKFGTIDSIDVPLLKRQPYTSLIPKNDGLFFGYVEYSDEHCARAAKIELDWAFLPNSIKPLRLFYPKKS